jgi:hypothetical protein
MAAALETLGHPAGGYTPAIAIVECVDDKRDLHVAKYKKESTYKRAVKKSLFLPYCPAGSKRYYRLPFEGKKNGARCGQRVVEAGASRANRRTNGRARPVYRGSCLARRAAELAGMGGVHLGGDGREGMNRFLADGPPAAGSD